MAFDSFLSLIILVGAIQGFIVSAILFFSNNAANRYLSVLIFIIALASLGVYWMQTGIKYSSSSWMMVSQIVPFFIILPIGPLIYFYVTGFTSQDPLFKNRWWHFAPSVFDIVPQILFACFYLGIFNLSIASINEFNDQYETYLDVPRWASVTCYLILSKNYLKTLDQKRIEQSRLKWLQQFINVFLVFQVIWFLHLVPYIIPSLRNELLDTVGWYPVYLPLAGLIYYFGIKGILTSQSRGKSTAFTSTRLSPERISMIIDGLRNCMTVDKLYLEPSLTVAAVSTRIGVPAKQISFVLNHTESRSFNEFVNYYRIEDFKRKIHDPKLQFMTISGIAFECGFNSQATFQRTFKASEGMSPSEYVNLTRSEKRISA